MMRIYSLLLLCLTTDDGDVHGNARKDWWAFQPLRRTAAPALDSAWVRTPIDAFVVAKLKENGLSPSPEADRQTLIRRLTFNLHGLPPTPQEVEAFLRDERPDAYERLVDRLLESPRYGERWGRHWLDVVHYGESHGYDKDKPRPSAWPYRDYVIRSFNADKPYARFVAEQLAGDVLFPDDPDGVIATGFVAAGPWDFVGHVELPESKTDGLIARYNDRDDMLMSTMSTFVSMTVHCARCHDHKFDPITQRDYYRLQAVFAGVDRAERPFDSDAEVHRRRRALARERDAVAARHKVLSEHAARTTSPEIRRLDEQLGKLNQQLAALAKPARDASPTNGYHSAIMPTRDHEKWVQVDLGRQVPIDEVRIFPARPTDFPDTPGFGYPLRFRVDLANDADFAERATLVNCTSADEPSPGDMRFVARGPGVLFGIPPVPGRWGASALQVPFRIIRPPVRFVRVTATRLWERTNDYVFALSELQVMSGGKNVALGATVTALDSIEAGRWSTRHLVDNYSSRRWLGGDEGTVPKDAAEQEASLHAAIKQLAAERKTQHDRLLAPALREELDDTAARLEPLNERLAGLPQPQSVYAAASSFKPQGSFAPPPKPRPIHLLNRGDVKQPRELMSPGSLACVPGLPAEFDLADPNDEGRRRAALAEWITSRENPLTWRSIVNRVWQYHFGRGIVDTPNDFGRMGSAPTHPELLDWLATWFVENGESLKKLHRLILTSSVYRQSSNPSTLNAQPSTLFDSDNRFLWRMNRTRLDAESIRDAALYVAGRLDLAMGGPSVQQFFFKDDHSPIYDYTRFDVDSPAGYRRSVYRFIVRSVPDPFMDCLDCADPSLLVPKRNTTLTALQALAMLNNRAIVRASEHFADRVSQQSGDLPGQIDAAFRLALGRPPRPAEFDVLRVYAAEHGLANACRLILNSNEFIFVD